MPAKQCALTLYRLEDIIGNGANPCQVLAVGVHQHPERARYSHLVRQHRAQLGMRGRHEMRQHRNTEACDGGVELRDQVGAAKLRGDLWRDLRQVVQFRREQQFLDVADEAMRGQVATISDIRRAVEIGRRSIEPETVVEQLAPDDAAFLRHRQADGDIGLALRQAKKPCGGDELQVEIGIPLGEFHQPRGQKVAAETVGGADPHGAGQMRTRAADGLLVGHNGGFHRFRRVGPGNACSAGISSKVTRVTHTLAHTHLGAGRSEVTHQRPSLGLDPQAMSVKSV